MVAYRSRNRIDNKFQLREPLCSRQAGNIAVLRQSKHFLADCNKFKIERKTYQPFRWIHEMNTELVKVKFTQYVVANAMCATLCALNTIKYKYVKKFFFKVLFF